MTAHADPPPAEDSSRTVLELPEEAVRTILRTRFDIEPLAVQRRTAEFATVCRIEVADRMLGFKAELLEPVDRSMFRWQSQVQWDLAEAGLPVSRPLIDPESGTPVADVEVEQGLILVQVYPWQAGTAVLEVLPDEQALHELGRTAARLRKALDHVPPAPSDRTHTWELSRSRRSITEALPRVRDRRVDALARRGLDRFAAEVEPLVATLPRAVVHQDLHDSNVLMRRDRAGAWQVSAILDFGDMVNGVRIADLVVAAAYASRSCEDPVRALAVVTRGWAENAPVSESEMSILLPAAVARLAVNIAVWSSRLDGAQRQYAAERMGRSIGTLERLLDTDTDQLVAQLA